MKRRQLTDAEISQALRARLPDGVYPGLRARVLDAAEITRQQRTLPSVFGALTEADPVARRRSLLIAAALLVALALASVSAVGALRLLDRDPVQDLSLEQPSDLQAFVLSSHDRMTQLPPVAITTLDSDATRERIYVDRSGAVRLERYASADSTEPFTSMILSGTRFGRTVTVGSNTVWVGQDDAIGDDPRVYIRALSALGFDGDPGCEMDRDPSEAGNGTAATGWRWVGADTVAGRPAHHLACAGDEVWIDDETRLILRVRDQETDDAGNPIPGAISTTEVTTIEFGEQPAALFAFAPPNGVAAMPMEAYLELCPGDHAAFLEGPPCAGTPRTADVTQPPGPGPEPSPTPTVRPDPSDCGIPSRDPGEPTGALAWSEASLAQDWPAPVRPEPAGGASTVPMPPTYIDPAGDTGSDALPCIDIRDLTVDTYDVDLGLLSNRPPDVDPSKAWIAYGVVVDDDRDGVPDWRYGIDNLPRTAGDENGHHREWRTNLHTGRTESVSGSDWASVSQSFLKTGYPAEGDREGFRTGRDDARFRFGQESDTTRGTNTYGVKVNFPFYTWASLVVDGRVVATDYAPDAGWLLPSHGAPPAGTAVEGVGPFRISMSVPAGWGDDEDVSLEFMTVDEPPEIACERSGGTSEVRVGPSVDDLVTFLEGLQTKKMSDKVNVALKISENADVTVDGYRGKYLEYTASVRDDRCSFPLWPPPGNDEDNHQTWILDVDGVRLVIHAAGSKARAAELRHIVESIDIGP